MAIVVQTPRGLIPTIPTLAGRSSGLGVPSAPLLPGPRSLQLSAGRTISFANIYRSQPAIATAVRRLSEQMARLPIHGFAYLDPDGDATRRDRSHPVAKLLATPRPRATGTGLRFWLAAQLKVHGNAVLFKRRRRRGAPPHELWQLDWRLLEPIVDPDGVAVLAWRYAGDGVPGLRRGTPIGLDDIIHLRWDGLEGEIGVSPLEQLGVVVRSQENLDRYARAALENGPRPGLAVTLDERVKNDATTREQVRESIEGPHGGDPGRAFGTVVVGGNLIKDLQPIKHQSAAEAELIQQRRVNREDVAAVFGIPQPLAGILDHATYSNIDALLASLFTVFLAGEIQLTAETLQAQLIDNEPAWAGDGVFVEHNLDEVLRADTLTRYRAYAIAVTGGWLTLNDVRRLENRAPYNDENADKPLVQGNNTVPLSDIAKGEIIPVGSSGGAIADQLRDVLEREGMNGRSGLVADELVDILTGGAA